MLDEPADIAAVQQERDEQAAEARRELELRGELPHGMPDAARAVARARRSDRGASMRSASRAGRRATTRRATRGAAVRLPFGPAAAYGGRLRALADELTQTLRSGQQVIVVSTQSQRLSELLEEHDVFAKLPDVISAPTLGRGALTIVHGSLAHGWSVGEEGAGLTLLTDAEVFGFSKQRRAPPRRGASRSAFLADLKPGEFVVHIEHGIARFAGLVRNAATVGGGASASTWSCSTPTATGCSCRPSRSTASAATSGRASTGRR